MAARATMTVEQAAEVLGISRGLAYRAASRGEIPAVKIGGRLLVPSAQLQAMLRVEPRESGVTVRHGGNRITVPASSAPRPSAG